MKIHLYRPLRSIVLPVLQFFNRDICISHHWTGDSFYLNLFKHKGYWYHGRRREQNEMIAFNKLIRKGDTVIEVGGHIGYLALLFSQSVGRAGKVRVYEPGSNNLPYLINNTKCKENIVVIEAACGNAKSKMQIFEDSLTGQNNSLILDFDGLKANSENAPGIRFDVIKREIDVVRIDADEVSAVVNFIKIDVEGFEYSVLIGSEGIFQLRDSKPIFMVEVQKDHASIAEWFLSRGYSLYDDRACEINVIPNGVSNIFALDPQLHKDRYRSWIGKD